MQNVKGFSNTTRNPEGIQSHNNRKGVGAGQMVQWRPQATTVADRRGGGEGKRDGLGGGMGWWRRVGGWVGGGGSRDAPGIVTTTHLLFRKTVMVTSATRRNTPSAPDRPMPSTIFPVSLTGGGDAQGEGRCKGEGCVSVWWDW